ncbi:hypothetical protein [Clostridium pasteurianum]|nr:hypothetical protein [Clostridium pasteurianum]
MKNSGMLYGCALGIVFGVVFNHIVWGMIIGIGSAIDLTNYSRKSKRNE